MGLKNKQVIGRKCTKQHEMKVMKSNAGYYIGTTEEEDGVAYPYCRATYYAPTEEVLKEMEYEERDCAENNFCNKCKGCLNL